MIVKSAFGVFKPRRSEAHSASLDLLHIANSPRAYSRIKSANILLITFKALANEVAKNLVLTGIGNLTIIDHETVTEQDLASQFFVEERHLGQNVGETLLPLSKSQMQTC